MSADIVIYLAFLQVYYKKWTSLRFTTRSSLAKDSVYHGTSASRVIVVTGVTGRTVHM